MKTVLTDPNASISLDVLSLLVVRVKRGSDLAVRDRVKRRICLQQQSSNLYVALKMDRQELKTLVVSNNLNLEWNENLTLMVTDPNASVSLTVKDHNYFFKDEKMGNAYFSISDFTEVVRSTDVTGLPSGTEIKRIQPNGDNCLAARAESITTVYDHNYFSKDEKMSDFTEAVRSTDVTGLPNGTVIKRIQADYRDNCLAAESCIYYNNGKIIQYMSLRLRNVECGIVEIRLY